MHVYNSIMLHLAIHTKTALIHQPQLNYDRTLIGDITDLAIQEHAAIVWKNFFKRQLSKYWSMA